MQIVREATRTRSEDEHLAGRSARERGIDDRERGFVLLVAPAPVAMNVVVIGHEPLVRGQARAQRQIGLVGRCERVDLERREQRAQPLRMVGRCGHERAEPVPGQLREPFLAHGFLEPAPILVELA